MCLRFAGSHVARSTSCTAASTRNDGNIINIGNFINIGNIGNIDCAFEIQIVAEPGRGLFYRHHRQCVERCVRGDHGAES